MKFYNFYNPQFNADNIIKKIKEMKKSTKKHHSIMGRKAKTIRRGTLYDVAND